MTFTIPGRLPSLNVTLKAHRYRFLESLKRQRQKRNIGSWIVASRVPCYRVPVDIHIRLVESNRRRDFDNIRSGAKVVLDALVATNRIHNDGQRCVSSLTDSFDVDKANPRIEVTIQPSDKPVMSKKLIRK